MQPILKWVGGKRQLLNEIKKYIPEKINTYFEPFIGGAAVLLELEPKKAVINDVNLELSNLYKVVKEKHKELIKELENHKKNHSEDYYYKIRKWDREEDYKKKSDIEKAARFIYLNKTCFNGLWRVNSKGQNNVPSGKYKNPNILDKERIEELHKYLKDNDIKILNGDFEECVKNAEEGDFVYFDPPYMPLSKTSNFTDYSTDGFDEKDQIRLKKICDELNKKKVKFLLSNSNCDFIKDLYKDYNIEIVNATRMINSDATKRGNVEEVLIKNY